MSVVTAISDMMDLAESELLDYDEPTSSQNHPYPWMIGRREIDFPYPPNCHVSETQQQGNTAERQPVYLEKQRSPPSIEEDDDDLGYCQICDDNVEHDEFDCPNRKNAVGMACKYCCGPCLKNWEGKHGKVIIRDMLKECVMCGSVGNHWAIECPLVCGAGKQGEKYEDF